MHTPNEPDTLITMSVESEDPGSGEMIARICINKTTQTLDVVGWSCGAYTCLPIITNILPSLYSHVKLWHIDIDLVLAWQAYSIVA